MKDQLSNPSKGNQNNPEAKAQGTQNQQRTAGNTEWNKGAETAKKGNQNWDEEREPTQGTKAQNQPQKGATSQTPSQQKTATGTTPQSKTGTNYTGNPAAPKR